jgi:alpha-glucuronidase
MLGHPIPLVSHTGPGTLVIDVSSDYKNSCGPEGFQLQSRPNQGLSLLAAQSIGSLYGAFHLLGMMQRWEDFTSLDMTSKPAMTLRVWDLWDNLDGNIERGYGGDSVIWPSALNPSAATALPIQAPPTIPSGSARYRDLARILVSSGLNGITLNNVNACGGKNAQALSTPTLQAIAATLFPILHGDYGLKVYLSVCYASPVIVGKLSTADPLDPTVIKWWADKADEIYTLMPGFGGFLVKADSEGQPGPSHYKRDEAQGANVLANALAPHSGVCIWRAFVYGKGTESQVSHHCSSCAIFGSPGFMAQS